MIDLLLLLVICVVWAGNFLMKPNHVAAWGLVGVVVGMFARGAQPWLIGLVLGATAWVFLLDWAYLLAGLGAGRRRSG